MSNPNIKEDRYLSNFATTYRVGGGVGDFVAPPFKVNRYADRYAVWDKSNQRIYDAKVVGREIAKEIDCAVSYAEYFCERYKLAKFLEDRTRDNTDIPINIEQKFVQDVKDAILVACEKRIYDIAGNASIVTQTSSPSNKWNNKTSGTPISDILTKKVTVLKACQKEPNRILMTAEVALQMIQCDEYKDYFKYTEGGRQDIFSAINGLRNIGLEPMIAGMFAGNTNPGGASDPGSELMWGESVLMFYSEPQPSLQARTFMYSPYTYKDQVMRIREERQEGTIFELREERDELLVDATCAYLWTNTLA